MSSWVGFARGSRRPWDGGGIARLGKIAAGLSWRPLPLPSKNSRPVRCGQKKNASDETFRGRQSPPVQRAAHRDKPGTRLGESHGFASRPRDRFDFRCAAVLHRLRGECPYYFPRSQTRACQIGGMQEGFPPVARISLPFLCPAKITPPQISATSGREDCRPACETETDPAQWPRLRKHSGLARRPRAATERTTRDIRIAAAQFEAGDADKDDNLDLSAASPPWRKPPWRKAERSSTFTNAASPATRFSRNSRWPKSRNWPSRSPTAGTLRQARRTAPFQPQARGPSRLATGRQNQVTATDPKQKPRGPRQSQTSGNNIDGSRSSADVSAIIARAGISDSSCSRCPSAGPRRDHP